MTTVRIRFWAAFAIIVVMWGMLAAASRAEGPETLQIVTSSGTHEFHVEIAKDDATRARGLMNRPFLPADRGMLFEFDREAPVSFWMKNTYIPLDMIFISRAGVVTNIVEKAEPLSERVIPSGPPCMAVLELNGGAAASIGLKVGDKVRHPFFKP
jgi:uncharacterized membrane protein (UPF0127 family)